MSEATAPPMKTIKIGAGDAGDDAGWRDRSVPS